MKKEKDPDEIQKRVKKLAEDIEAIINQDRILKEVFKTSIDR